MILEDVMILVGVSLRRSGREVGELEELWEPLLSSCSRRTEPA